MVAAALTGRTLLTRDGVRIDAAHLDRGDRDLAVVLTHGFANSWRRADVRRIAAGLGASAGVICFDLRGHGRSSGLSTLGDLEVLDLAAAVGYARHLGYARIAAVGFSLGASVVIRYASMSRGLAAVVSVSGLSRWQGNGSAAVRRIQWTIEQPMGRLVARVAMRTRISARRSGPVPEAPAEVIARIAPTPVLIVHGDRDAFFPVTDARELYEAAAQPKELWIEPGFGHAEKATGAELVARIGAWIRAAVPD